MNKEYFPGMGCKCAALGASECGCINVDWRSRREVELEKLVGELQAKLDHLNKLATPSDQMKRENLDLKAKLEKANNRVNLLSVSANTIRDAYDGGLNAELKAKLDKAEGEVERLKDEAGNYSEKEGYEIALDLTKKALEQRDIENLKLRTALQAIKSTPGSALRIASQVLDE